MTTDKHREVARKWLEFGRGGPPDPECPGVGEFHRHWIGYEHKPLTEAEFNEGCRGTYVGVPLVDDERGDYVIAYDHIDPAQFVEAVAAMDREDLGGDEPVPHDPSEVQHRWAITTHPAPEWHIAWENFRANILDIFPITVIERR